MAVRIFRERSRRRERPEPERSINSSLELFEGLSAPEITRVGQYFTTIDVAAGRDLGRHGTPCQYFGVVLAGQVGMSFNDAPAGILHPGGFWGSLALLNSDGDHRRLGTASAMVDSRIAVANPREFAGLLHTFPLLDERIRAVTARLHAYVVQVRQDRDAPGLEFPAHIPESTRLVRSD